MVVAAVTDPRVADPSVPPLITALERWTTPIQLAAWGVAVALAAVTLWRADDAGGTTLLVDLLATLAGVVLVVVVAAGASAWVASTSDHPAAARRAAPLWGAAAALALAAVVVAFNVIRQAFDDRAALVAAGNRDVLASGWATVAGLTAGVVLFCLPTLLGARLQRSPDTAGLAAPAFSAGMACSVAIGTWGLLVAYGGAWVPELVEDLPGRTASGVLTGSILAVAGLGLSLVFGVLGIVNFAHAQFLLVGAYVALYANTNWGWTIWWAVLPAVVVGAALGIASDLLLFRPMRRRGVTGATVLILSIGAGLFLQYLVLFISQGRSDSYEVTRETRTPLLGWDAVELTPTEYRLIVISVALVIGVTALLTLTRLGKAVRAAADDLDLAALSGIDVNRVIIIIWALAGGLATYGGVAASLQFNVVTPLLGLRFVLPIFAAVIVGGLGNAYGALLGGLLLGLAQEVSPVLPFVSTEYQEVVGFVFLVAVLVLRPQGLLGRAERV